MADERWIYETTGGAPACSMAPVTTHYLEDYESATSATSSTDFKPPSLHDGAAAASSSSFLADPHMDWTQAYMGGRAVTTSFNASLQLHGDAGGRFPLDQTPPQQHLQYNYDVGGMAPAATLKPFTQHQFSSFPGSSGIFRPAAELPRIPSVALESKHLESKTERVQEACSTVKRRSSVPDSPAAAKKPRIEPPPPLPTFKVRKEKLGDRITALQQLVSPFGKTDTASVLHEAIEYIKFLHNQVASLSSPYLRFGRHVQIPQQQDSGKARNGEAKEPLSSRGLCLVPLASTYMVANETALELWHPTFGGTFRQRYSKTHE